MDSGDGLYREKCSTSRGTRLARLRVPAPRITKRTAFILMPRGLAGSGGLGWLEGEGCEGQSRGPRSGRARRAGEERR